MTKKTAKKVPAHSTKRLLHEDEIDYIVHTLGHVEKRLKTMECKLDSVIKCQIPDMEYATVKQFHVSKHEKKVGFSKEFRKKLFEFSAVKICGKRASYFKIYETTGLVHHTRLLTGLQLDGKNNVLYLNTDHGSIALWCVKKIVAVATVYS